MGQLMLYKIIFYETIAHCATALAQSRWRGRHCSEHKALVTESSVINKVVFSPEALDLGDIYFKVVYSVICV